MVECVEWDLERKGDYWREPSPDIADLKRRIVNDTIGNGDLVFIEDTADCASVLPDQKYMIQPALSHVSYSGDPTVYRPLSDADEAMRVSLGMTRAQWDEWNPGGGWSDPKPITGEELRHSALYWVGQADKRRREARVWAGVAIACLLLVVAVLLIPNGWVYHLFEAFK